MIRQFLYATTVGILATNFATADLHVVDLVGLTFVPNEITVAPGDTVQRLGPQNQPTDIGNHPICRVSGKRFGGRRRRSLRAADGGIPRLE